MAPKSKAKAKSIQRERKPKSKSKPNTLEQNTNVGEGQQQVVKVVIQQPEPPKPKRRAPKSAPKVDKKKDEAIEELKEAIADYDKVQTEADEMGVKIPKELGISPLSAGQIKNADDILAFIKSIREKTQQIKQLEIKKKEPEPAAPAPAPKPNMFLTPPAGINRAGQFSPFIVGGNTIQPAPIPQPGAPITPALPPSSRRPIVPQVPQAEIDRELADIERTLNQATTPEELAFEDTLTKIQAGVFTIRDDIQKTYSSQNNRLAPEQVKNYKQRYENRRKDLEKAFVKMPTVSQTKLDGAKSSLETVINDVEERLGKIEQASQGALPSPDDPVPEDPNIPEVDAEFAAAVQLLKQYIEGDPGEGGKPMKWSAKIIKAMRRIGADDVEVADVQALKPGFPRRQAVAQFLSDVTGGLVPSPAPDPSPPKPTPPKPTPPKPDLAAARQRLINFVNNEDIMWSKSLFADLKLLGASLEVQNAVSETLMQDEKRKVVKKFLGLAPTPPAPPPGPVQPTANRQAFNQSVTTFNNAYKQIQSQYQNSSMEQRSEDIKMLVVLENKVTEAADKLSVKGKQEVANTIQEVIDKSRELTLKIQTLIDVAAFNAYRAAVTSFNQLVQQIGSTYNSASFTQIQQMKEQLNSMDQGVDETFRKMAIQTQNGLRTQKNTNNERYRDLLAKLNAKKTFSVAAGGEPDEDPAVPQPRPNRFATGPVLTPGADPTAPGTGGPPGGGLRRNLEKGFGF